MSASDAIIRLATRLFRACVRLYPHRFRIAYGSEMETLFRHRMIRASSAGSASLMWSLLVALQDVLAGAFAERFPPRRPGRGHSMFSGLRDIRIIVRRLATRDRQFALFACATMSLGYFSAILIFSLVNGVLLKSVPYKNPTELVGVVASNPATGKLNRKVSLEAFETLRTLPAITAAAHYEARGVNVTIHKQPQRVAGAATTPELFRVLGVEPLAGRLFSMEELGRGDSVAVVSELLIQRSGWTVAEALGRTVTVDGQDRTVVGVMPASFRFPETARVWIPSPLAPRTQAVEGPLAVVARVRAGHDAALEDEMQTAAQVMARAGHEGGWRFHTRSLNPLRAEGLSSVLFTAVAGAVLLMFVVTANVAALMLARGIRRQAEFGIMAALGASRSRIVLHLLLESAVIAAIAGGIALLLTTWTLTYIPKWLPLNELPEWIRFEVDARVALFAWVAIFLGMLGTGLIPSLQSTRGNVASVIHGDSRSVTGGRATRMQHVLVGAQLLVATVLLIGGGLMLRSYLALAQADLGYDPTGVSMLETELSSTRYPTSADTVRFYEGVIEKLRGSGGVIASAVAGGTPEGRGGTQGTGAFEELELSGAGATPRTVRVEQVVVSAEFFETLRLPITRGRSFRPNESDDAVVVNEAFVRRYWSAVPVFEQSLAVQKGGLRKSLQVIGVAADMRDAFIGEGVEGVAGSATPRVYLSLHFGISRGATVYARDGAADDANVAAAIRQAVSDSDPDQPVWATTSLTDFLAATRSPVKWFGYLLGFTSAMALIVACVGLYGVVSYAVRRRQREFAIRATFGATPSQLITMLLRDSLCPSVIGLALGIGGGVVLGRALSVVLYGIPPFDVMVTGVTSALLLSAACAASLIPSLRLCRVEPAMLLHTD